MPESKISDDISEMIKSKSKTSPEEKVRVLISLDKGASLEEAKRELAKRGLEIENAIPGPIPVVSGSVSMRDVSELAAVQAVKKVERDSEIRAL